MNTKLAIAAIALTIGSIFSSASFAQSGTLSFTGSIVAPACTASINLNNSNANSIQDSLSLGQCANSNAQVVRTSIDTNNTNTTAAQNNNNSAIVTVSYE